MAASGPANKESELVRTTTVSTRPSSSMDVTTKPQLRTGGWFTPPSQWDWRFIGARAFSLLLLWGCLVAFWVAMFEIGLAVRGTNYIDTGDSHLRKAGTPSYSEQPTFPWVLIQQSSASAVEPAI